MFGRKEHYTTVSCRGRKVEGGSAPALKINELDMPAIIKKADSIEGCGRVSFGRVYQKPGTMLSDHDPGDMGYTARYDKVTRTLAINLRQGLMRQTVVLETRDPVPLAAELGLALEVETPSEPTAG